MNSNSRDTKLNKAEAIADEANLTVQAQSADVKRLNKLVKECRASPNPLLFQEISQLQSQIKKQTKAVMRIDKLNGEEIDRNDPMFEQPRKPGVNK